MILDPRDPDGRTAGSVFLSPVITPDAASRLRTEGAPVNEFPDGATRVSASWLMKTAGFSLGQQLAPGARIYRKHHTLVPMTGPPPHPSPLPRPPSPSESSRPPGYAHGRADLLGDLPAYARLSAH